MKSHRYRNRTVTPRTITTQVLYRVRVRVRIRVIVEQIEKQFGVMVRVRFRVRVRVIVEQIEKDARQRRMVGL